MLLLEGREATASPGGAGCGDTAGLPSALPFTAQPGGSGVLLLGMLNPSRASLCIIFHLPCPLSCLYILLPLLLQQPHASPW